MSRPVEQWQGKTDSAAIPPRTRICAIDGCGAKIDCHGLCASHASRLARHGDPLGGTTNRGACIKFMAEVAIPFAGDECLTWPFGTNGVGYGTFHINRKAVSAHVHVCTTVHGDRPSRDHEAAHTCGNGHRGCCNPRHLRWATRKENKDDMNRHGTSPRGRQNPQSRLTEADVRSIRSMKGAKTERQIAEQFGVAPGTIGAIHRRKIWGWLI